MVLNTGCSPPLPEQSLARIYHFTWLTPPHPTGFSLNFSDPHLPLMFPLLCAHNSPHFPYQSTYSAYLPDCAAKHAGSLFTTHQLQPHLFLHTVWAGISVNCSSQICHDSSSKASVVKLHNVPLCSRPYSDINIHIWNGTRPQEKYQGGEKA